MDVVVVVVVVVVVNPEGSLPGKVEEETMENRLTQSTWKMAASRKEE